MRLPYIYDTSGVPDRLLSGYAPDPVTDKQEVRKTLQKLKNMIQGRVGENGTLVELNV
jgi:hypothetical protein